MRVIAIVVCFILMVSGCSEQNESLNRALALRDKLQSSNGCCFRAVITADYGEKIYTFTMDCQSDKDGNVSFSVTNPVSIAGITGVISNESGAVTFDDYVLAFQTIADEQITPVTAPWILIKTLRSGFLKSCTESGEQYQISIDDSYDTNALHLNIWVGQDNTPVSGEVFWQGRRVLTILVENFRFL